MRISWISVLITALALGLPALRKFSAGGKVHPASLLEKDLKGDIVIVTGTSLNGIGWHTALQLAKQHATVVVGNRDAGRNQDAVKAILVSKRGGRAAGEGNPRFCMGLCCRFLCSCCPFSDVCFQRGRKI